MEQWRRCLLAVVAAATVAAALPPPGEARLSPHYYSATCPNVESTVRSAVAKKINETVVTIPAVLRLFFHDCLVQGCDASVIIASPNNDAEKDAQDNMSLAGDGFDTVNRAKAAVEKECPGKVSCADILAIAARDVVALSKGPSWTVELGRLDGLVSNARDVDGRLPGPDMNVASLMAIFQKYGFTLTDMIALSGAHTVGFAHCTRFTNRLYNHSSDQPTDPTYNPTYAAQLKQACPQNVSLTIAVNMDPVTPVTFDNTYFSNLANGLGLFTSDNVLYTEGVSQPTVKGFTTNQTAFFEAFKYAMIKLGRVGVKTGKDGEIRKDCTAFNRKD